MGTPPPIQLATIGWADSLILMVIALVVFGPRRLPEIGRQVGKLMYEFRKASNDFKFQMEEELRNAEEADRRKKEEERLKALALAAPAAPEAASQVSEARPGAPDAVPSAASVMESVYPEQTMYPSPEASQASLEEIYPRIQPPSTGEQVPAAKPHSITATVDQAGQVGTTGAAEASPGSIPEATCVAGADEARAGEAGSAAGADSSPAPGEDSSPAPGEDIAQAAHHG
jgi:sec-independent protein translocase protein TatB